MIVYFIYNMATLTQASEKARNYIKYGGIGFVVITVLWYLGLAGIAYYNKLYPPAPPPPTVDFGQLASVNFPESKVRANLLLELPTGRIPGFPDRLRVYKAPTKRSGFADPGNATDVATSLGFLFKPLQRTDTDWVWTIQDQLNSKLEMNIVSGHFVLTRQWQNNPSLADLASFASDKQVLTETENYLKKINLLSDDVVGVEKVSYLKADAGNLVSALSLSDADFIQLDMFRKNLDEIAPGSKTNEILSSYPFYRTDPSKGLIRVITSGGRTQNDKIIYIEYSYTAVQYDKNGTYPIKTGEEAWDELQKGGGFVTINSPKTGDVKIRRIFLGYYDADNGQNYSMPIYIFLGDQGFTAYVSAVKDEWIKAK